MVADELWRPVALNRRGGDTVGALLLGNRGLCSLAGSAEGTLLERPRVVTGTGWRDSSGDDYVSKWRKVGSLC